MNRPKRKRGIVVMIRDGCEGKSGVPWWLMNGYTIDDGIFRILCHGGLKPMKPDGVRRARIIVEEV